MWPHTIDPGAVALLAFVTLQRLAELVIARRNDAWLRAQGGIEHGAAHYPVMVALHASWLAALWVAASGITPSATWVAVYAVLQGLRLWTLLSLGRRWTTRVIVLEGAPRVRRGPYRIMSHPNYAVVAAEICVLPMAFGLVTLALVFTLLNAAMLAVRLRVEERALAGAGTPTGPAIPTAHRS
jgi:methyltransferase